MKRHIFTLVVLTTLLLSTTLKASTPGEIIGWGNNSYGQSILPVTDSLFTAVAGGYCHSLGLTENGSVAACGRNNYGQCNVPEPNTGFMAVAAGGWHSLGLKSDGSIVAWGHNGYGQCDVPLPNTGFTAVAAGYSHSIGLKSNGSVVVWGRNDYGQCNVPWPNTGFVAIVAGSYHSLGLKQNGSIVAWGYNYEGQCNLPSPNTGFTAVAAGREHSMGLKSDGSIVAWGRNLYGQCSVPLPNSGFTAIAAGAYHSLGLKSDGSVTAWGYNGSGQRSVPSPNTGFAAVAAGGEQSLAIGSFITGTSAGNVNYGSVFQQIEGFGGAGCYDIYQLTIHSQKEAIYDLIFRDLGLEIFRIKNSYNYGNSGGSGGWNDLYNDMWVVWAAKQRTPSLKILMSAWSPPDYLKSNNDVRYGGTLATDAYGNFRYGDYADWWADAVAAFTALGMKPDWISIQNEVDYTATWESCRFNPTESYYAGYNIAFEAVYQELYFRLGSNMPKMLGPETMGIGPGPWGYPGAAAYINELIDDSHLYGYGHHLYPDGDGGYNNPDGKIPAMQNFADIYYGRKPIYMTEYSGAQNLDGAIKTAWHIHNALVYEKINVYYYWSLWRTIDSDGAIRIPDSTSYTIRPAYYAVKHYSKFTDANWYRVDATPSPSANLRVTAFKNPAGNRLTIVVVNVSNSGVKLAVALNGFSPVKSEMYRTSRSENWAYLGAFNPSRELLCPRQSIITISLSSTLYDDCSGVLSAGDRLAGDIAGDGDCYVDYVDFAVLANHWLDTGCVAPDNCHGADFEPADGIVDFLDLRDFAEQWMWCNDPQSPDCLW